MPSATDSLLDTPENRHFLATLFRACRDELSEDLATLAEAGFMTSPAPGEPSMLERLAWLKANAPEDFEEFRAWVVSAADKVRQ